MLKKYIYAILITCITLSTVNISYGQSFEILKKFPIENPLSYRSINTITQDHEGFMWFGSQEGVHKYDGYDITTYLHNDKDPTSLSADVVSQVFVDSKGRIWVATRGSGLNLYVPASNSFEHINRSEGLSNDNINVIYEDNEGKLWIGTEKGLNVLSEKNGQWNIKKIYRNPTDNKSLSHNTIQAIVQTDNTDIWIGSLGGGVSIFDKNGDFLQSIEFNKLSNNEDFAKFISALYEDKLGNVWIGTIDDGLIKVHKNKRQMDHFLETSEVSITSDTIESIYQDSNNNIWIATDQGISIFNEELQSFSKIQHVNNQSSSLSSNFVLTVFEDSNQMIWVGTFSGINRWDPHMATFTQYGKKNSTVYASQLITSFNAGTKNVLWISAYDGDIYTLNLDTKIVKVATQDNEFKKYRITTVLAEQDILWIGTRSSGLLKFNTVTNDVQRYVNDRMNPDSISANSITDIFRDSDGTLWISTYHRGLNKLNKNGVFTRIEYDQYQAGHGPNSHHILQILEDDSANLWLATYGGGVNQLNKNTGKFTYLTRDTNMLGSISSDLAWIMFIDSANNLWVGTQDNGINILTAKNISQQRYKFSYLNVKDGMKDQTVYGFEQDNKGNIWFSSNKGISRYSPESNLFKHFDSRHGLTDLEFNHGAVYKASNNQIFFGSAHGFSSIDPNKILEDHAAPSVRLTNIFKLNAPMTFDTALSGVKSVSFEYSDQLISFAYVGLNYSDAASTRYKYRLKGFDKEWIDAGNLRRATYTNLPAGHYKLQVLAANSDDNWSELGYTLNITVNPAPWHTWWAYLLYVFSIALLILLYSRKLNEKLVEEQRQKVSLKEQVIEKTKKYVQKNRELELANNKLEKSAIVDKLTGAKSRRYLDIYIEQTSQLMTQVHQNLQPLQRSALPRLYVLMAKISDVQTVSNGQIANLADLMMYTRNADDLVVRWAPDTLAIIGYEKDNSAAELSARLSQRLLSTFREELKVSIVYSYFPFDIEQPKRINWDQCNVLIELVLTKIAKDSAIEWVGILGPKLESFDYLETLKKTSLNQLEEQLHLKYR